MLVLGMAGQPGALRPLLLNHFDHYVAARAAQHDSPLMAGDPGDLSGLQRSQ